MDSTKYNLRYLPLFYEDLEKKIVYIAEELHNEKATNVLHDALYLCQKGSAEFWTEDVCQLVDEFAQDCMKVESIR